ncbi:MAG: Beta-barrel assembly-enhancing protease [Chlamydiae bacterium]|nr:Beta-barrel assembly-enhancing protease [Chlamydiota bacterium]
MPLYFTRMDEVKEEMRKIAKKINLFPPSVWVLNSIDCIPSIRGREVFLPYLFLLKTSDIPKKFQVTGFEDPRLKSDAFLQEVADWSRDYFNMRRERLKTTDKYALRLFLNYIRDPKLTELTKKFVLSHEMAHEYHKHSHGSFAMLNRNSILSSLLITAGILCASLAISLSWHIIAFLMMTAFITTIAFKALVSIRYSRACEKEADLTAAKISPDAIPGGIYLFKKMCEHGTYERKLSLANRFLFSSWGNNMAFFFTHPPESERAKYLEKLHQRKRFERLTENQNS